MLFGWVRTEGEAQPRVIQVQHKIADINTNEFFMQSPTEYALLFSDRFASASAGADPPAILHPPVISPPQLHHI